MPELGLKLIQPYPQLLVSQWLKKVHSFHTSISLWVKWELLYTPNRPWLNIISMPGYAICAGVTKTQSPFLSSWRQQAGGREFPPPHETSANTKWLQIMITAVQAKTILNLNYRLEAGESYFRQGRHLKFFFLLCFIFIWKAVTEREIFPNCCNSQRWAHPKPGIRSLIWLSHAGAGAEGLSTAFQVISRGLDLKQRSQNMNLCLYGMPGHRWRLRLLRHGISSWGASDLFGKCCKKYCEGCKCEMWREERH